MKKKIIIPIVLISGLLGYSASFIPTRFIPTTKPYCVDEKGCDDNNNCTIDFCLEGQCLYGQIFCSDFDPCTNDACTETGACDFTPVCDDNDPCTTDICECTVQPCNPKSDCSYESIVCPPGQQCNNGICMRVVKPDKG